MVENRLLSFGASNTNLYWFDESLRQFLLLFYFRCWKWSSSATILHVVITIYKTFNQKIFAITFLFAIWRFPFNTKSVYGYLVACFLEFIMVYYLSLFATCVTCFAIGTCLMLISLTKDVKCVMKTLNSNGCTKAKHWKMFSQFIDLIELHSNAKRLSTFDRLISSSFYYLKIVLILGSLQNIWKYIHQLS